MERSRLVVALASAVLVFSLFIPWREQADDLILFGAVDRLPELSQTGWERWELLDIALVALAAGLMVWAARPNRILGMALGVAGLLVAGGIALNGFDGGVQFDPGLGPFVAMGALGIAVAALAADTL